MSAVGMDEVVVQPVARARAHDASGRDRLVKNVLASWGGHAVFIVAGFVMPRMIDRQLGQLSLGIWDFSWSIVSYFNLAQVGIGSSVNRYVAKHRAAGDVTRLRRTVSSVNCVQLVAAALALALTGALTWGLPALFGVRLGMETGTARWVIALLGSSVAVHMAFNAFGGVLTGCHRWDTHSAVNAGSYALSVFGMIGVLWLGGGLPSLAAVYLGGTIAAEIARMILAYRVCPEVRIHPRYATWAEARTLLAFGGKTVIDNLSRLLLAQANSILVVSYLGPGALAVYARPTALVRHADTLTNKFAQVLTPAASSLKGSRQLEELRQLFIDSSRVAAFLAMPVAVFLSILGDPVLHLWMGPRYREGVLMAIVAVGGFLPLTSRPAGHVLIGLNAHGRVGWASLAVAVCGIGAAVIALGPMQAGLMGAALALVIPYSLGHGFFVMAYACRRVGVPLSLFGRRVFGGPLTCALPLAAALLVVRAVFAERPALALACGGIVSAAVLGPLYWSLLLTPPWRKKLASGLRSFARRLLPSGLS